MSPTGLIKILAPKPADLLKLNGSVFARFSNTLPTSANASMQNGIGSSVTATPSSSTTTVDNILFTSGYNAGEIDKDTGDVLYIENRSPITRASDQTENVKLIIEFQREINAKSNRL